MSAGASVDAARVDALYQSGVAAWQDGRHAEAAAAMAEAIALEPTLPALHYLSGSALFELGRLADAQQAFEACATLRPGYPLVLNSRLRAAQSLARRRAAAGERARALPATTDPRSVSVIICSIRPERYARVTAMYRALLAGIRHEIIGIHDAKSLCEGYNRGMRQATGDILVFSHDDIEVVSPDFAARLLGHLATHDVVGVAGTTRLVGGAWVSAGWPHIHGQIGVPGTAPGRIIVTAFHMQGAVTPGAQAMDGVLLAARAGIARAVGFDEQTFDGWHLYDFDFTFAAHLAGHRLAICHDLHVVHDSTGNFGAEWQRYAGRFMQKYRDRLPAGETLQAPELCSVEAASADEWRLMTEYLTELP